MGKGKNLRRPGMLEASALRTIYRKRRYTFHQLTSFAPEQWLVYDDGPLPNMSNFIRSKSKYTRPKRQSKLIGYIRQRHGYFTASWATGTDHNDMKIGKEAYDAKLGNEVSCFIDWNEREHYLSNALMALTGIKSPLPDYSGKPIR